MRFNFLIHRKNLSYLKYTNADIVCSVNNFQFSRRSNFTNSISQLELPYMLVYVTRTIKARHMIGYMVHIFKARHRINDMVK